MAADPAAESRVWLQPWLPRLGEPGATVLDLGCGDGEDAAVLVAAGFDVSGCDREAGHLRSARANVPAAAFARCDISRPLPFRTACFDAVTASLSLHYFHWATTVAIVDELVSIMRPSGVLLFRVNASDDLNFGALGGAEVEPGLRAFDDGGQRPLKRFFTETSVRKLFGQWTLDHLEHRSTYRWGAEKRVWLGLARPP